MKISVLLHSQEHRGDHIAEVMTAHDVKPGETVEQLAERLLCKFPGAFDRIEIRRVMEPDQ